MQTITGNDIQYAAGLLKSGDIVAIPTETVYGLAADALNALAVAKIFEVKKRPAGNPLIVHIADIDRVHDYVANVPDDACKLMDAFCPGPLTILLPRNKRIPDVVTAGSDAVAIRIPGHPLTLDLLKLSGLALAAPSANISGYISPTKAVHVDKMLSGKIKYILDGGPCSKGIESTIVGFTDNMPVVYRAGAVSISDIEQVTGKRVTAPSQEVVTPGSRFKHYSPATPFIVADDIDTEIMKHTGLHIGVITYNIYTELIDRNDQLLLCTLNDMNTASRNLYAAMHDMDERNYDVIIARRFPQAGIGIALNDRLNRASNK